MYSVLFGAYYTCRLYTYWGSTAFIGWLRLGNSIIKRGYYYRSSLDVITQKPSERKHVILEVVLTFDGQEAI